MPVNSSSLDSLQSDLLPSNIVNLARRDENHTKTNDKILPIWNFRKDPAHPRELWVGINGDNNSKEAHADIHNDISDGTTEKEEEKVQVKIMLYRQFLQVSDELCKVISAMHYKKSKRKISHNFTHTCRTCIILT